MITVLTGGTGGAKFVDGLRRVVPPEDLTIIVNTGDDHEWWGLHVSPDIDSIMYMLAGTISEERGWGVRNDTFHCLQTMHQLGEPSWFSVGDRDLAIHLLRTQLLSHGKSITEATRTIAERLGIRSRILPMSDSRVETRITTPAGELSFEEYFVKRRFQDPVKSVRFEGAPEAQPAPRVIEAINAADAVLIAPSNPVTSVGPILAIAGIRDALQHTSASIVAVSPIIGNAAVTGPATALMAAQCLPPSIAGIAAAYGDFMDVLVVHESDSGSARQIGSADLQVHSTNILMRTSGDRTTLARTVVELSTSATVGTSLVEAG
jgi:LPPG:FO 2-phospho-L-lactate transferase